MWNLDKFLRLSFLSLLFVGILLAAGSILISCEEVPEPVYHYKVYRENADGGYTSWTLTECPTLDNGYTCWKQNSNDTICISGKITIEHHKVN